MGVSKNSGTPKWMVYYGKPLLKWMIWRYHYFRKPPNNANKLLSLILFVRGFVDFGSGIRSTGIPTIIGRFNCSASSLVFNMFLRDWGHSLLGRLAHLCVSVQSTTSKVCEEGMKAAILRDVRQVLIYWMKHLRNWKSKIWEKEQVIFFSSSEQFWRYHQPGW